MSEDSLARTELWELCEEFIEKNEVQNADQLNDDDMVMQNAAEFIERICDIVGYSK